MLKVLNFLNNENIFKLSTEFKHNDYKHYDKLLEEIKDAFACNDSTKIIKAIDSFNIVCRKQAIMDTIKAIGEEMAEETMARMANATVAVEATAKDSNVSLGRGLNKHITHIDELGYAKESSVDSNPIEGTNITPLDEMVFLPEESRGELSEEEREVARRINSADTMIVDPAYKEAVRNTELDNQDHVLKSANNYNLNNCDLNKDVRHPSGLHLSSNIAELIKEK